ncbi:hypothetical protein ABGV42_08210 [Paenibacillus pabuli]
MKPISLHEGGETSYRTLVTQDRPDINTVPLKTMLSFSKAKERMDIG